MQVQFRGALKLLPLDLLKSQVLLILHIKFGYNSNTSRFKSQDQITAIHEKYLTFWTSLIHRFTPACRAFNRVESSTSKSCALGFPPSLSAFLIAWVQQLVNSWLNKLDVTGQLKYTTNCAIIIYLDELSNELMIKRAIEGKLTANIWGCMTRLISGISMFCCKWTSPVSNSAKFFLIAGTILSPSSDFPETKKLYLAEIIFTSKVQNYGSNCVLYSFRGPKNVFLNVFEIDNINYIGTFYYNLTM